MLDEFLPDGEGMTKVNDIVDRWNTENPNIHVTATKFDGAAQEMIKKVETDINAGAGPCLAQLGYSEVPELFVKGLTEDVTEYATQYESNYSGAFNMMKVGETIVGLPQDTGPLVYFYNKAAFEELGIEVPTTLEEFQTAAATAAAAGKYIATFQPDEAQYWLSAQSAAAGGSWYNFVNDEWKVDANSDASAVVADFWQKMLDDKTVSVLERWGDAFGKSLTGPDGGSGVAVMKGCEHPEQAMEFNNWFNTQIDDLVSQGLVVAAKGEMTTPENISAFYGGQDVFAELATANANLSADFAYMPFFSAVGPSMVEAAAAAGSGSGTVADVFTAAQDASIKALTDGNLPVAE